VRENLISEYGRRRDEIRRRLRQFGEMRRRCDESVFAELCFCICTAQSKAVCCDRAVSGLARSGVLFNGGLRQIRAGLEAVRFPNNKARYILEARALFSSGGAVRIKDRLAAGDNRSMRLWLTENVKGLGLKEASHFLRNVGLGRGMAILDVHILKNLARCGVINAIPETVSRRAYFDIEERMGIFARDIGIPMEELDLLFWSLQTGFIFK